MAGRYPGSYLDRSNGRRAATTLADTGRASLVGRIPDINMILSHCGDNRQSVMVSDTLVMRPS